MVAFVNVEVAHFFVLRLGGGQRMQRRTTEEGHFHVLSKAMEVDEPALAFDAVKGLIPFHRFLRIGNRPRDERVELPPNVPFPPRHRRDVGLDGSVTIGLRDLWVAA